MSQSSQLRLSDLRAVFHLVGECRDLGDDPGQWRSHFARRLMSLTGAGVVVAGEITTGNAPVDPAALRRPVGEVSVGWENGFDRAAYARFLEAAAARTPAFIPILTPYMSVRAGDDGVALTREDIVPDRTWYRSEYYRDFHEPIGVDAAMYSYRSLPVEPAMASGLILARAAGERDFSARHRAVVREVNAAVAGLIGGPLAGFGEPSPAELPPRTRAVLRCLLEGDGDKQIATRLGLRPLTVNQHTKLIYRHFWVQSRAELLARWVHRGWGARCAWAGDGQ